ncbi:MAG: FAD-binding oxidoreductase [Hyphomicrobiales bacterium]|nr:FAD-binding oxidoreductase [Hyphomicrobiales bacterium]
MNEASDIYYRATAVAAPPRPALEGHIEAQVCVVGGGLAGLMAAYEAARLGRSVVLLEAETIGYGASGRNGGFVSPGFAESLEGITARLGLDRARELVGMSREAGDWVRGLATDLPGADPVPGWIKVVRYDDAEGTQRRAERWRRDFGRAVDYWPTERVREVLRTPVYYQALYDADAFHIHPLNYALGLAGLAEAAGARLFEHSLAEALSRAHGGWRIAAGRGTVEAQHVVLAGSAYMRRLYRRLSRAVLPVATHVVVSEPLGPLREATIRTDAAIGDTRRASDYYRVFADGRLMWGGGITTRRAVPWRLAGRMKARIAAVYPALRDVRIDFAWSGLMGYAVHRMPLIGEMEEGLWAATAFGGHGLSTSAMAGRLVAAAIAEGDDRWRLFTLYTARWGGGALGRAATQLVYWKLRLADRIEEARSRRGTGRREAPKAGYDA